GMGERTLTSIPFAAGRNASAHNTPRTNRKLHLQEALKPPAFYQGPRPKRQGAPEGAPLWWRWGESNPRPKVPTAGLYARSPRFACPPGLARGRAARSEPSSSFAQG